MPPKSKGTVLITGGAKRVGAAIATHLAEQGYSIALHYHQSRKEAQAIAQKIPPNHCDIFKADLEDPKDVQNLIPTILKRFPDLNVLINNASIFERSTLKAINLKDLDQEMAVNFRAPLILTSSFAHYIREGQIINILDTHVSNNRSIHASYLLAKKALGELTKLGAVEFAPAIRVNAIAPGLILPPEGKDQGYLERLAKNIPLKRKGSPTDIAKAAQFLIENTYITGQTIFVDGGGASRLMALIRITDLTLKAIIGINAWERKIKQDVIINLELDFDSTKAAKSDKIADTVDYKSLKKRIIELVESSEFFLLEKLVEQVLDLIMKDPKIRQAKVRIDKPKALRFAKSVSIESSRSKSPKKSKTRS